MFGVEIYDSGMTLSILVAFGAGMLSFLSPCILPIVPPYLAFLSGLSFSEIEDHRARGHIICAATLFVLGLSVVFLFLGYSASTLGRLFIQNQILFGQVAGGVIIVFGLHFLGLFRIAALDREYRFTIDRFGGKYLGAFVLGLAFAFGWVPCIGPQLGAILSLAAQEDSVARGTALLGIYALGLGLPFILSAAFIGHFIRFSHRMKRHMAVIEKTIGLILIGVGLLLLTNRFTLISFWLIENMPFLALMG